MSNVAWECPRCLKINAPFNPSCFCRPKQENNPIKDAIGYLTKEAVIPIKYPKPLYPEHGWLASSCGKCHGYYGSGHNADNCSFSNQSM